MTRTTYRYREGRILDDEGMPMLHQGQLARTEEEVCMPFITGDIPEYQNMLDGKMIRGRSEHREFLKKNNLIELGNDEGSSTQKPKTKHVKHEVGAEIKEAIDQLKAGYINPDEGLLPPTDPGEADLGTIAVPDDVQNADFVRADEVKGE